MTKETNLKKKTKDVVPEKEEWTLTELLSISAFPLLISKLINIVFNP